MTRYFSIAFALLALLAAISSCTDDNTIDTGLSDGKHNMSMLEYFQQDPYNFDSLRVMIQHAGLTNKFSAKLNPQDQFTMFAPTNHSIRRYLLQNGMERVADIAPDKCLQLVLDGVLQRRLMLDDFKAGRPSGDADELIGTGGEVCTMESGKQLWIYSFRDQYNGVPEAGPSRVHLLSPTTTKTFSVASHNIETLTGVVHAMENDYTLCDF